MASMIRSNAKHVKKEKKSLISLSAWLSYLVIATLILSSISLARYTAISSDSDSARAASFSVSAEMKDAQNNVTLVDGGICEFEVTNSSEVSVTYKVILKGVPAGVYATLTAGEEAIRIISNDEDQLISVEKLLESGKADVCTLSFTASEEVTGAYDISVQVQFEQTD